MTDRPSKTIYLSFDIDPETHKLREQAVSMRGCVKLPLDWPRNWGTFPEPFAPHAVAVLFPRSLSKSAVREQLRAVLAELDE